MAEIIELREVVKKEPGYSIIPEHLTISSFKEAKEIFLLHCRAKNLSPKTIPWYGEKLGYFEGFLNARYQHIPLYGVTANIIKEYICFLQEKEHGKKKGCLISSYTVAGITRVLKVFFHFLQEEGYLSVNPCEKIKIPKIQKKIIKALTNEDIQKLLSLHDTKTFIGLRNYLMLLTFLDTGIRLSELLNLHVKDIDWQRYTFKILGKGNKERETPFGMKVAKLLIKYLKWRESVIPEDFVFVDKFGQKLKIRHVAKIVDKCGKKTGVEKVHCHRFRHTFALNWIKAGGDALSLQRILGHTTLDMVRNYVNLATEDLSLKHRQFGFIDRMEMGKK